jgi:hypothetical protein
MPDTGFGHGGHEGRFEAPERYVGFVVYDPLGQKIGSVERLFVNGDGEPVYVRVRMGAFGFKSALLPVGRITVDEEGRTLLLR